MSKYTTGELAKLCGVTVRTVQYYDSRNILIPSELSEGGRRLYSEEDLRRMKIICFLRDLDLPINAISQLLAEKDPGSVIDLLLQQQEALLQTAISEQQEKLDKLKGLQRELKIIEHFSVDSLGDIAHVMEGKKKLNRFRWLMVLLGIPATVLQWTAIILWITHGYWWLMFVWLAYAVPYGILISRAYFRSTEYICPQCHSVFKPGFKEMFWANHTPNTRKLTCTCCGHKGFCVEIWAKEQEK